MQLVGSLCKRHAVAPFEAPTACKRTVSGSLSLPCSGSFSPFPHGTGPLSVFWEYLALRDGPREFRQDSSCPALLRILLATTSLTRTGLSPSADELSRSFRFDDGRLLQSYNPGIAVTTPVWALSVSLATTREIDCFFLFLQVLRCFSSLR